jgi:UDP-N-acetylglucosamine acyltransferase
MSDAKIHPTAEVHPRAAIGDNVEIGPFCVVEPETTIGDGSRLYSHVVIAGRTTLGRGCQVHPFAVLGGPPQDRKFRDEPSELIIGDEVQIREHVTIHRGTALSDRRTTIGNRAMLMAYCHVAHDCRVGDDVVMTNGATLAGHVEVEPFAVLGGFAAVGQMLRVGESAMLAAGAMVEGDAPPYCIVAGDRATVRALNLVGLKRRGFTAKTIGGLRSAHRLLFRSGLPLAEAIETVRSQLPPSPQIDHLLEFLQARRQ